MLISIRWTIFCQLVFSAILHSIALTNANGTSTTSPTLLTSNDSSNTTSSNDASTTTSPPSTTPASTTAIPSTTPSTISESVTSTLKQTSTIEMDTATSTTGMNTATSILTGSITTSTSPINATSPNSTTTQPVPTNQSSTTMTDLTTTGSTTMEYINTTDTSTNATETVSTTITDDKTTTSNNVTVSQTTSSAQPSTNISSSHKPPPTTDIRSTTMQTSRLTTAVKNPENDGINFGVIIPVVLISVLLLLLVMVLLVLLKRNNGFTQGAISFKKKRIFSIIVRKRPIILENIAEEVKLMHKDDNLLFSLHYEDLAKLSPAHSTHQAVTEENKWKNRFINVIPFDYSRVLLPVINDDTSTDYINANYIPGYTSEREYIATQGPLPNTINDFWRMIWHHKITSIVMLTPLKENEKVKCEQYWPDDEEPVEYGDYVVEKSSSLNMETYVCTTFNISADILGEVQTRTVKHYHYQHWRDMSAAVERSEIIDFIRTVRLHLKPRDTAPIVVHCSAGVGRTGTYIVLDYIQQFIQQHDLNEKIDIFSFVLRLRNCRVLMVQTESQYRFLYDCAVFLVEEKKRQLLGQDDMEAGEHIYENTRQEKNGQLTTVL